MLRAKKCASEKEGKWEKTETVRPSKDDYTCQELKGGK